MKTIWKYQLQVTDTQYIEMPPNAEVLSVGVQNGQLCIWVKVDPNKPYTVSYHIAIIGTGHAADRAEGMEFVGTFQLVEGNFVAHVFYKEEQ